MKQRLNVHKNILAPNNNSTDDETAICKSIMKSGKKRNGMEIA